jgi:type I restriction enzyme R subunit
MAAYLDEAQVEIVTVDYFRELGHEYIRGPVITPDGESPERQDYARVVLTLRLQDAMVRINLGDHAEEVA